MTAIDKRMPDPWNHIEVSVTRAQTIGGKELEPVVHVMNTDKGQGHMLGAAYAEAEAHAVLEALAEYQDQQETT